MVLRKHSPKVYQDIRRLVAIDEKKFRFNAAACRECGLMNVNYMQVHLDSEDRRVVFEPMPGNQKKEGWLKLGGRENSKTLTAKGIVSDCPWIKSIVRHGIENRKFEISEFDVDGVRGWSIQLMPAFENSVAPSEIHNLGSVSGIYRYLGGDDGKEVIYIGKGKIRDRFQTEPKRKDWGVSKVEYSIVEDEETAYKWERFWIDRFEKKHNGRLPRFNFVGGRKPTRD